MKILSIDVGIKNLAICLFDQPYHNLDFVIKKWDIINLIEEKILKCGCIDKNKMCNKPAKLEKNNVCFCLKHAKKQKI